MKFPWHRPKPDPHPQDSVIAGIWAPLWRETLRLTADGLLADRFVPEYERVRGLSGFLRRVFRLRPQYRVRALPSVYDRKAGETVRVPHVPRVVARPPITPETDLTQLPDGLPSGGLRAEAGYEVVPWIDPLALMPAKRFKMRYDPTLRKWVVAP